MKNNLIKDRCRKYRSQEQMLRLIIQTAKSLQVDAVALSGSRTNQKIQTDEFQDYDVVYIVDDLDYLTRDLSWLTSLASASLSSITYLTIAICISCSLKMAIVSI